MLVFSLRPDARLGAKPFYFRFKPRITEQFQKIYTNEWILKLIQEISVQV